MSYMRGEFYVWGDGNNTHINDVMMPDETFEELVAMYWYSMTMEEQQDAKERAVEKWSGNFGCMELSKAMGVPTALDILDEMAEDLDLNDRPD